MGDMFELKSLLASLQNCKGGWNFSSEEVVGWKSLQQPFSLPFGTYLEQRCSCYWQIAPQGCLFRRQPPNLYSNSSQYFWGSLWEKQDHLQEFASNMPQEEPYNWGGGWGESREQACSYPITVMASHGYWWESGYPSRVSGIEKKIENHKPRLSVSWSRKGTGPLDLALWNRY